jgi:hypothetical protein
MVKVDRIGQRHGRLVVLSYTKRGKDENGKRIKSKCTCRCDCGNITVVQTDNLDSGNTTSCGCYGIETRGKSSKTHGNRAHPLYAVWNMMKSRCNNPKNKSYPRYGERGIKVCSEWEISFENFWNDMFASWSPGMTLERVDNDKGYSPDNCIWANRKLQARNTRRNVIINTPSGPLTIAEASEKYGIKQSTIWMRINRRGWDEKDWLKPV